MKKILFVIAALAIGAFTLPAAEQAVNGAFAQINPKTNMPAKWYLNAWPGYKPAPTIKTIQDGKATALEFTNIKSKSGFGVNSAVQFKCKKGQKVTVTARIKGNGTIFFQLQTFGAKAWTGILDGTTEKLTADWKEVKIVLPVEDAKGKAPTVRTMFTFGARPGTTLLAISSVKVVLD